ncbi:cellulose binding domain-containing protein [Paractinoplanes brasiliensis]|uniref:Cellulose binding domain-containing protein n=1 Tax=Paractinoplanes brasiliensis TaxID=52695 RepID=A0A4R6JS37_9ACTN|nr:cellulose binding domain-containing protein [Actinoplanes brasiliensis]TDO38532.1 cellulose binding domain-containing protein [Actinoplanes brasiliensis]GID26695.1 hypothetical protein Abr02nite_16780 [Actinoplanes brasiliensis]
MAAKHSVRVFGTARFVLSFAVAVLVLLVVWIAVRAVGPAEASKAPTLVLPPVTSAAAPPVVSSPPSVSPTPSRTPSRAPRKSTAPSTSAPTHSRSPERTRPPVVKTTPPPPRTDVKATLSVGASWDEGYVAAVRVVNEGRTPVQWKVTVSHSGQRDLQLRGTWNARGDQQGSGLVFTGGTLAPGQQASFGYQVSKTGRGKARPAGCNALGGSCSVR